MELRLILGVLKRRWWLALTPVIVVAALTLPDLLSSRDSAAGTFTTTVRYSAAQVLEAIPGRDGDFQDVWLASELAVNALTDWVRTSSFVSEIVRQAATEGVEVNAAAVSIAADNSRSIGQLIISYPDMEVLSKVVDAAVDVLKSRAQNYFPQLGGQAAQVTLLDVPVIHAAPPPIANRLVPVFRLVVGLLAGVGLAFLAEYLDPTIRQREHVEALGLPVIATLPRD